jgi:predicted NBD/HSP70 family sugar kinase
MIKFEEMGFSPRSSAEKLVDTVAEIVQRFLRELQIPKEAVLGIGIAVPGPLDVENGIMINPPNFPGWKQVPVQEMLQKRLGMRVCLDKETNLAALAESFYGVAAEYKTTFFLSLFRLGIGGGLLSENNIFHGFRNGAGEVGHMTVEPSGCQCGCGGYGCLEAMIAEDYVLERARYYYKIGVGPERPEKIDGLTLEKLFTRSEDGDEVCEMVVKQMAAYISIAIGNVINMFSPELIILGGDLPALSNQLVELVAERIHSKRYPSHCRDVQIVKSSLGAQVYVKGGTALVQKNFLRYVLPENF